MYAYISKDKFSSVSRNKIWHSLVTFPCPAHLNLLDFITLIISVKSANHEALLYAILSTVLLLHPSYI